MSPESDSSSPVTQPGLAGSPRANQWAMSRGTRGGRVLPPRWDGASVVVSWVQSQGKLYRQMELTGDSALASSAAGVYVCAKCGYELFSSRSKYAHSSPWPAFTETVYADSVTKRPEKNRPEALKVGVIVLVSVSQGGFSSFAPS